MLRPVGLQRVSGIGSSTSIRGAVSPSAVVEVLAAGHHKHPQLGVLGTQTACAPRHLGRKPLRALAFGAVLGKPVPRIGRTRRNTFEATGPCPDRSLAMSLASGR